MSQENLIRASYKAWRDGDLDALLETLDPNVELVTSGSFPDLDPAYRGHDGIRNFWARCGRPGTRSASM
jgi:ketosteroid isomerase-like protein